MARLFPMDSLPTILARFLKSAMLFAIAASSATASSAVDALPAAPAKSAMLFIIVLGFGDAAR